MRDLTKLQHRYGLPDGVSCRTLTLKDAQLRAMDGDDEDQDPRIEGYAALFGHRTELYPDLYEELVEGCFDAVLASEPDVCCLLNHDPCGVIARTSNDTLSLKADEKGLWYSATPNQSRVAQDAVEMIRRGDISQSSFAFVVQRAEWVDLDGDDAEENSGNLRRILEIKELWDVSPVTYPAYADTTSTVASRASTDDELAMQDLERQAEVQSALIADLKQRIDRRDAALRTAQGRIACLIDRLAVA